MAGEWNESAPGARALPIGVVPVLLLLIAVFAVLAANRVEAGEEPQGGSAASGRNARQDEPKPPHDGVRRYEIGLGPRSYWLFEPDRPRPEKAPVVVFLHGWFAVNPAFYGAWIDHLVRNGHIVIFPRYQNDITTMPQDFLPNAVAAIHDAMGVLSQDGVHHVRADSSRFALIGHSAGANLAAQHRRAVLRPTCGPS